jgi:hypothetical protein
LVALGIPFGVLGARMVVVFHEDPREHPCISSAELVSRTPTLTRDSAPP